MKELFFTGGPLFMSILSILYVFALVWLGYHFFRNFKNDQLNEQKVLRQLKYAKTIGSFALVMGVMGQLLGIYGALSVIEQAGDVSPLIIFGGFKVSMISTLYGMLIYLSLSFFWFIAGQIIEKRIK